MPGLVIISADTLYITRMFKLMFYRYLLLGLSLFFAAITIVPAADDIAGQFSRAEQLGQQGKLGEAMAIYRELIKQHPQLPEAYNNLAALYLQQKKPQQAKEILEQGIRAHKGYAALYDNLVAINVAMAREAYSKALQLDSKPGEIRIAALNPAPQQNTNKTPAKVAPEKVKTEVKEENIIADIARSAAETREAHIPEVNDTLQAWATAWSAQAVDLYLSFYDEKYRPANGQSRAGWEKTRRYRLTKPKWIKVSLSDIKIQPLSADIVDVNFRQVYESNSFTDNSYKKMRLHKTEDGWRILSEQSR